MLCLYVMGLNLSNRQIALELKLSPHDAQAMTEHLRRGAAVERACGGGGLQAAAPR